MNDLIRKNDALDILCKFCGIAEDVEKCRKTSADGWCKEYCELKNMPTVDAEPIRHGRWIRKEWAEESEGLLIDNYECSVCKSWVRNETNYCPNCGAKMDAERKEE